MGLFDVTGDKLKVLFKRARHDSGGGAVDPRKNPELDRALTHFAKENGCSYSEAYLHAKTRKRSGRWKDKK